MWNFNNMIKKLATSSKKYKFLLSFLKNSFLNMFGNAISILVLQLVLHPNLAKIYNENSYGVILTTISIISFISVTFGSALENIRLINYKKSDINDNFNDDYNRVFFLILFINSIVTISIIKFIFIDTSVTNLILIFIYSNLALIYSYIGYVYKLKLYYFDSIITSILSGLGYILGVLIINRFNYWQMPFILSLIFPITYLQLKYKVLYFSEKLTTIRNVILYDYIRFFLTSIVTNFSVYLDRFIILFFLGTQFVTIYSISSFLGKSTALLIYPISSVLFSYLSLNKNILNKKQFNILNLSLLGLIIISFFILNLINKWFIMHFYSYYYTVTIEYAKLANLAFLVVSFSQVLNPFLYKFVNTSIILKINMIHLLLYIIIGSFFSYFFKLNGITIAIICVYSIKWVLNLVVINRRMDNI